MKTAIAAMLALSHILKNRYILTVIMLCFFQGLQAQKIISIKAEKIMAQLKKGKTIHLEDAEIVGDIDFTKLNSHRETYKNARVFIESPMFFKNCKFQGKLIGFGTKEDIVISTTFTKNLSFLDCIFYQNIELNSCVLNSVGSFSGSHFYGELNLMNSFFDRNAFFNNTIFAKDCHFQNSRFGATLDLSQSIFNQNVNFQGSSFFDFANFRMTEFREGLDCSLCLFFNNASFNFCTIKNKALFSNSHFRSRLEFENIKAKKIEMDECIFDNDVLFNDLSIEIFSLNNSMFLKGQPSFNFKENKPSEFMTEKVRVLNFNFMDLK